MLRLDPKDLPPHLEKQVLKKLNDWNSRSKVELIPQKHEMLIKPKKKLPVIPSSKLSSKSSVVGEQFNKSPIHEKLWRAVRHIDGIELEFKGAIPKRRFSLDIAIPSLKIAIEVDGWQYHGKYKESHTRDRERQNLLTLAGWRVLRYTAKQINENIENCVNEIEGLIDLVIKNEKISRQII